MFQKIKDAVRGGAHEDRGRSDGQSTLAPSDRSRSRGRDAERPHAIGRGRGGAGNVVRSSSRDPAKEAAEMMQIEEHDQQVEAKYRALHKNEEHAAGRGGFGNVPHHHSTLKTSTIAE
ncbi:hypothetical protein OIV83_006149 [Microbotryomycetes sp. JL201]|nr:hypothetical protein OIV83_006149 [Microbotryomycetes sp. JL201]